MKDRDEGLRLVAKLRRMADKHEKAGRSDDAELLRDIALRGECIDYGLYLLEYKYGV